MRILTYVFSFLFLSLGFQVLAQDKTTIEAKSEEISDNFDLEAVASLFAEVEDLEEFEERLNDPEERYSNLDLNEDGYVDYLRVLEKKKGTAHLVSIQAVIGKDQYQDVATIDVEKDRHGKTRVQVVGDVYMYGPDYIIEPVYVRQPIIFSWFWGPRWSVWYSPWHWGYYPTYWSVWRPYHYPLYYAHVRNHVHVHHHYHYTHYRRSSVCKSMSAEVKRNDLAKSKPESSFAQRNSAVKNKYELDNKRGTQSLAKPRAAQDVRSTGREIKSDWKPTSARAAEPKKSEQRAVKTESNPRTEQRATQSKEEWKRDRPTRQEEVRRTSNERSQTSQEQRGTTRQNQQYEKPRTSSSGGTAKPQTQPRDYSKPRTSSPQPSARPSSRPQSQPRTQPSSRPPSQPRTQPSSRGSSSRGSSASGGSRSGGRR